MKRIASTLIVGLFLGLYSTTFAKEFADISLQHPNAAAVQYLSEQEVFRGQGDGEKFDPLLPINRAEWAQTLVRLAKAEPGSSYRDCFFDIYDQWYAAAVCFSAERGWIKGYQAGAERGYFIATNTLNIGEILVTLARVFNWNVIEGDHWYSGALEHAKNARIVSEETSFDQAVTRAQAAEILFRAIALQELKVSRYEPFLADLMLARAQQEESTPPEEEPASSPSATVTLSPFPEQPAKSTLARGSLYVPVLRFLLEADREVKLQEISVRRFSVGRTEDLGLARLLINGRVLHERSFFSSENAVFWSNLDYSLPAGEPVLIEMNVDFEKEALPSLVYQFETTPERIKFEGEHVEVIGEKIQGKLFSVASPSASVVTVTNPDSALKLPFVESTDQILGRFQITAGEHDVVIKRIRLEDAGDVNAREFNNFRLTAGSDVIGTLPTIERNVLDFQVNDYLIEATRTRTFTVLADIDAARIHDTIRLYMEEAEHLHAFDIEFGFGAQVDNQFTRETAWCVGSNTPQCPTEGLRKHCSKEDREAGVRDCEEEEGL